MGTFALLSPSQALDKDDEIIILQSINIWIGYNQMSLSRFVILSNFSPTSDWLKPVILDFCRELRKLLFSFITWLSSLCIMRTPREFIIHSSLILLWYSINTPSAEVWGLFFFTLLWSCACPHHILAKPSPLSSSCSSFSSSVSFFIPTFSVFCLQIGM